MSAQIDRRIVSNKCIARSNGKLSKITRLVSFSKHCQRHNRPEGWVLLIKVTSLGQITSSYKTLDQTYLELHNHMKHQQQNNDQTSASKSCLNINFKILTKLWNLVLKGWTKNLTLWSNHLPNLHQNVVNMFLIVNMSNSNNLNNFWVVIFRGQSHINQVYSIGDSQSVI